MVVADDEHVEDDAEIESYLNQDDLKVDVTHDMLDLDDDSQGVAGVDPHHQDGWHCYHWEAVEASAKAEDTTDLTHYSDCSPFQAEHDQDVLEEVLDADADYDILETDETVEHVETDHLSRALEVNGVGVPPGDHGA